MQKDDTEELTGSLNTRAMLFLELNNFNTALSLLHQANYLLKNKKQTELIAQLKVTTLNNLGCVYKRLEKPKKALFYLNEALSLGSRYSTSIDTSSVHLNISSIKSSQSAHEEALFHALSSLKLCSLNFSDLKISALLSSYYQTGSEYSFLHKSKEAKKYFKLGFELAHKHLGKSHQMTLKFFKSLHDKSLNDIPAIKKAILRPIIERVGKSQKNDQRENLERINRPALVGRSVKEKNGFGDTLDRLETFGHIRAKVKSTEPRNEYKIHHHTKTSVVTPIQKLLNRSSNISTNDLIPNRVKNQITYIGNALGIMQKKIDKYSESFQFDQFNEKFKTFSSKSSSAVKRNRVKAGLIVQKTLKMWKDRKKFIDLRGKVIKIQRAYRKMVKVREIKSKSLVKIKASNFSQQFSFKFNKTSGKNIECQTELDDFCDYLEIFATKKKRLDFWKSLVSLQRAIRKFLNHKKRVKAALLIQKYFRGFIVRKKFFELIKVIKPSKKIKTKALTMIERRNEERGEIIFKSTKRWTKSIR